MRSGSRKPTGRNDFDAISEAYAGLVGGDPSKLFVQYPWAFEQLAGQIHGQRILDVGCGDGSLGRILAREGGLVCGYDVSAAQIERARREERLEPLGVEYLEADPRDIVALLSPRRFDSAVAVTVLHYAESVNHLAAFFSSTFELLEAGGRFAALVMNPSFQRLGTQVYGRRYSREAGRRLRAEFFAGSNLVCSTHYTAFTRVEYERAATAAGFPILTWVPVEVTAEGRQRLGDFWAGFEQDCPYAGFIVSKPQNGASWA